MTVRTRYFVIVSLLVVGVGLGTGLVAYYVGFPTSAFFSRGGPEELRYLPCSASVVAYADVSEVMASELRQRFRESLAAGAQENGQREFQEPTGINIETDIDRVVACFDVTASGFGRHGRRRRARPRHVRRRENRGPDARARRAGGSLQGQAPDRRRQFSTRSGPTTATIRRHVSRSSRRKTPKASHWHSSNPASSRSAPRRSCSTPSTCTAVAARARPRTKTWSGTCGRWKAAMSGRSAVSTCCGRAPSCPTSSPISCRRLRGSASAAGSTADCRPC